MRAWLSLIAGVALCAGAATALAVEVGDKAPDIDVTAWIQGDPVVLENCVGKKIVVLEFWATVSEPSKKAIPRLSRLAERHKDHDVDVVAVSDEKLEVIKAFAEDGKFKCKVACDGERNTSGPYTRGLKGLPFAVVIDKEGVVVWKGPAAGLDRIVDKVVAGKYGVKKAEEIAKQQAVMDDATDGHSWDEAGAEADKLLDLDSGNEKAIQAKFKQFHENKDVAKCKAFIESLLPTIQEDSNALNVVAWTLITMENNAMRQPAAALKAARRAVERTDAKDGQILDTFARVQYSLGLLEDAIETQRKAVAADAVDEGLKGTLNYYLACVEARKDAAK